MNLIKLTKRENEIMEVLWDNNDKDMTATDIMNASKGISLNTIQQSLQKLLKMNYIYVSKIGKNNKSLVRLYRSLISENEYITAFINQSAYAELATSFIKQTDDDEVLKELIQLIEKKRESLKR
ncbi:BlaI/MecI/CopY family transcriptional regulator [Amedibacillus sp. YH-ame10]